VIRAPSRSRLSRFSERLGALREGLGFAVNAIEALAQLAESVGEVSFAPGATIWRAGDQPAAMIVPVEGVVRGVPGESRVLGGLEMLAGRAHRATLTAVTAVRGLRVEREDFLDVLEDHQDLARDMLAMLAMMLIGRVQGE
jgi:CRP-like cAMP-binding protein